MLQHAIDLRSARPCRELPTPTVGAIFRRGAPASEKALIARGIRTERERERERERKRERERDGRERERERGRERERERVVVGIGIGER
jgi:hypothetical protein